jgi:uncharacterized membrane protein
MPITVILVIALICVLASMQNGYLGAFFLFFMWGVLVGMIRDSVKQPVHITEYTWAPHLLWPVIIFLVVWQWRLRGRIGPPTTLWDLLRRRRTSSYA